MKKKILCIVALLLAVVFLLASCDNGDNASSTPENSTHTHAYGEWETKKAATCTAEGSKERYCSCGEKQTASISATGHSFGGWVTVTPASALAEGSEARTCVCGVKETRAIPKTNEALTNEQKGEYARTLISEGKITDAYNLLQTATNYAPAQEMLKNFFYAPQQVEEKWKYSDDVNYTTRSKSYTYNAMGNVVGTSDEQETFVYDADGNILSGCDLIYGTHYIYTYQNGKLYQRKSGSQTTTYYYNSDGLLIREVTAYGEYSYEYSEVSGGTLVTVYNEELEDGCKQYYDANGLLVKTEYCDSDGVYTTITITYGAYGISGVSVIDIWGETATFVYTYDTSGILTKLEAQQYDEGEWYATYIYTFSAHQLCYSENPSVQERVEEIYMTDNDAAMEIIW